MVEERPLPADPGPGRRSGGGGRALKPVPLAEVEAPAVRRLMTGIGEVVLVEAAEHPAQHEHRAEHRLEPGVGHDDSLAHRDARLGGEAVHPRA